jgi:thiol reductant ABC exporter CydC subunit
MTIGRGPRRVGALALSNQVHAISARRLVPVLGAGGLSAICSIGLLATSGWLIARASLRPPVFVLSVAIGAVQAFSLGRGIARYFERLRVHSLALEVLGNLRAQLYAVLEPLVPGGLGPRATGAALSGFVSDTELVAGGVAKKLSSAVDVSTSIAIGTMVICLIQWGVGAALAVGALGTVLVVVAATRTRNADASKAAVLRVELADLVVETIRSAPELVAFGREDLVASRLDDIHKRSRSSALRRAFSSGIARAAGASTAGAALLAVLVVGLRAHDRGQLSGVMFAVVVFVTLAVLESCLSLPAARADAQLSDAAADRLAELQELEVPVHESEIHQTSPVSSSPVVLDDVEVKIGGTTLLDGISFELPAGTRMGLVGRSGSGKTSVLFMLLHFLEHTRGSASIGGIELAQLSRQSIADRIGWLPEDSYVFAASLAENLRIARPLVTDFECVGALERVGLGSWYRALPEGLATVLGAGGRPMSAGERQRLGIARVVLSGADVLLLDEPTSHLDPASSATLLADFFDAAGSRSVLVVSHERDISLHVDGIVCVEAGKVVPISHPANTERICGERTAWP